MDYKTKNIFERAEDLIELLTSHPSGADDHLIDVLDRNDLREIEREVTKYEAVLAEEHFRDWGIVT